MSSKKHPIASFIGGLLGTAIGRGIRFFWSFLWLSRIITALVLGFNLLMIIKGIINNDFEEVFSTILCTVVFGGIFFFIFGIIASIVELPANLKRNKYEKLFINIGFTSKTNEAPYLIKEEEDATEYIRMLAFYSQIPLNEWIKNQSYIETFINAKITRIISDEDDNNIIYVLVKKKDLPSEILWSDNEPYAFVDKDTLSLGMSYEGLIGIDLNKNPHVFVAGETGSGKSNILKGLIYQAILNHQVILIDFKRGVSFSVFDKFINIYSEHEEVKIVLEELVKLTNARFDLFRENRVENINEYNAQVLGYEKIPRIIVIIDELAELIKSSDKETTKSIVSNLETLTRLSRAAGVNLIMGIQRPDSTVISGQIKNNVTCRICGRFIDPEPSRIMFGTDIATTIPNIKGRFIIKDDGYTEFQAFRFTDEILNMEELLGAPPEEPWEEQEELEMMLEDVTSQEPQNEQQEPPEPATGEQEKIIFNFDDIPL